MEIRNFWVDIESSSGERIGAGPLRARTFRKETLLSASGTFEFTVPGRDPNLGALQEKRIAICRYVDRNGMVQVFGGGVIDRIVREIDETGKISIVVSGNDLTRELTYRSVGNLDLTGGSGAGVNDAPEQIMALAPAGWSITNGLTLSNVYAGYDGESVLNALIRAGEKIGEHWRLGNGRVIEWLGTQSAFLNSNIRAVQHVNDPVAMEAYDNLAIIRSLTEESDAADLVSRVIPRGSGNGSVILDLGYATDSAPSGYTLNQAENYLKRDDTESNYGRIERTLDFKEIGPLSNTSADLQAASNMLLQASVEHLRRFGAPQKFYRLEFAFCPSVLTVGKLLWVIYRSVSDGDVLYDLNQMFNVVSVTAEISESGIATVGALVSTIDRLPIRDGALLASDILEARVLSAHQQLGASVDTFTYRDEMDNSHGASFRFWLGDEYVSIQRAVLRFRIQPLRSTVKSIGAESITTDSGGASTSGSGGSSNPTSSSGGGSSLSSGSGGAHGHSIPFTNSSAGTAVKVSGGVLTVVGGSIDGQVGSDSPSHTHSVNIPSHTHDVNIPAHTHTTPNHTHTLTPSILMEYGIFEESGANTLALANLVWAFNGGALPGSIADIGNGWYEFDITDALVDDTFRPVQENNEIAITTSVAKTARIEMQLTVRGVVQAVNYQ